MGEKKYEKKKFINLFEGYKHKEFIQGCGRFSFIALDRQIIWWKNSLKNEWWRRNWDGFGCCWSPVAMNEGFFLKKLLKLRNFFILIFSDENCQTFQGFLNKWKIDEYLKSNKSFFKASFWDFSIKNLILVSKLF